MDDLKNIVCQKCNTVFQVGKDNNGKWIRRKLCPNCSDYNKTEKQIKCHFCGENFTIYRLKDNKHWNYKSYKCPNCREKEKAEFDVATKKLVCQKCGKQFDVSRSKISGDFLLRKYCFDCDDTNKPYRIAKCVTCGKEFKQYRTACGGFSETKYCSHDCSLIQRKTKTCLICGKEFELERSNITGNFKDNGKYCSDECAKIGWRRLTKETCQRKYGVDLPCQSSECVKSNPTNKSKISDKFYDLLLSEGFNIKREFILGPFTYDFKFGNILLELNPTFTHTCYNTGVYPPKNKTWHYNKSKYAKDRGYICVCVWDWDNWQDVIDLVKQKNLTMIEDEIKLYYSKGNKRIDYVSILSEDELIKQNYLPVYTDGYIVLSKEKS